MTPPRSILRPAAAAALRAAGRRRGAPAFTLMEVMLAVAIASVVLIAVTGVFFGALRLRNRTSEAIEASVPVERALSRIRRDLLGLVPPGGALGGAFQAGSGVVAMTNALGLEFGQVGPEFRTRTGAIGEDLPWSEVQRVAYLLLESTNQTGARDLYRSVTRNLLSPSVETPESEWLLGNVENLTFQFHDGTQWLDTWDSTAQTNQLPRGIRVELQRGPREIRGELPPPLVLVIPILVDGNTNHTPESVAATNTASLATGGFLGGAP